MKSFTVKIAFLSLIFSVFVVICPQNYGYTQVAEGNLSRLIEKLQIPYNSETREDAIAVLKTMPDQAIPELIRILQDRNESSSSRATAAWAFERIGFVGGHFEEVKTALKSVFDEEDILVRDSAIAAYRKISEDFMIEYRLLQGIPLDEPYVGRFYDQHDYVSYLGQSNIEERNEYSRSIVLVNNTENTLEERISAIRTLGENSVSSALGELTIALGDFEAEIRSNAAQALKQILGNDLSGYINFILEGDEQLRIDFDSLSEGILSHILEGFTPSDKLSIQIGINVYVYFHTESKFATEWRETPLTQEERDKVERLKSFSEQIDATGVFNVPEESESSMDFLDESILDKYRIDGETASDPEQKFEKFYRLKNNSDSNE